jgi:plastocyanin
MRFPRFPLVLLALAAAAIAVAVPAGAAAAPVQVRIQHELHGCHSWSVANGTFAAKQMLHARTGTVLKVTNNDVMPHTLVQLAGPRIVLSHPRMAHMSATTALTLRTPGTYRFTTKAGEDYPGIHVKTIGEDNILRLTVIVS